MTQPTSQWVPVPCEDGTSFDAFLALPPAGRGPGLLLLQEVFGVNDHIRGVAAQYARSGFVVMAPDLFWRDERKLQLGYSDAERQRGIAMAMRLSPQHALADLRASLRALHARDEVDGAKVGALGYCLGGRLAYVAATLPGVDAAVAYYGGGIQDQLDLAPSVQAPMQFHYAEHDDHIPPAAVARVREALHGRRAEFFDYPAHHGFNCWDRGAYHPVSAALAHGRTLGFLAQHLF